MSSTTQFQDKLGKKIKLRANAKFTVIAYCNQIMNDQRKKKIKIKIYRYFKKAGTQTFNNIQYYIYMLNGLYFKIQKFGLSFTRLVNIFQRQPNIALKSFSYSMNCNVIISNSVYDRYYVNHAKDKTSDQNF